MNKKNQLNRRDRSYVQNIIWIFIVVVALVLSEAVDSVVFSFFTMGALLLLGIILLIKGIIYLTIR